MEKALRMINERVFISVYFSRCFLEKRTRACQMRLFESIKNDNGFNAPPQINQYVVAV